MANLASRKSADFLSGKCHPGPLQWSGIVHDGKFRQPASLDTYQVINIRDSFSCERIGWVAEISQREQPLRCLHMYCCSVITLTYPFC